MKYILLLLPLCLFQTACAATFVMDETKDAQGSVTVHVSLDPQEQNINAVSGSISIPKDMAEVGDISTAGSIASLWLTQPYVSKEFSLDGRIHIPFEAVMPGGFSGVRSAYYKGEKPGELFSFTLLPKRTGDAVVLVENVDMRLNDGNGTQVPYDVQSFTIPLISVPLPKKISPQPKLVDSTLQTFVTQNNAIADGKWVLVIHDDAIDKTPQEYDVAESSSGDPNDVYFYEWRTATFPYVLSYQSRNRFIQIKAIYTDGSFSYTTIQPVENSATSDFVSRILIGVLIAILLGYVFKARTRK